MILGIFLALGDSFTNLKKNGQDESFKKLYISALAKNFEKVYIFTYLVESTDNLPKNVILLTPTKKLHRYIYGLFMPFIHAKKLKECDVIRAYHITGALPAVITTVFSSKPFMFNYAYDYSKFARVEKKIMQVIFFYFFKPIAVAAASAVIAANRTIEKNLPPKKTYYLPNGVNTKSFKPIRKKEKRQVKNILSVGRLETQKNFENLIKALSGIKVKLIIVGKGSLKTKLKSLARKMNVDLKIITRVKFFKMPVIYQNADIFVSSSLIEGSPKALLEAMSTGLPIVATNVEGNRDLIKNEVNGLLCETSARSIHDTINRLIKDKKKAATLGQKARLAVEREYNLDTVVNYEVRLLQQLAKNN